MPRLRAMPNECLIQEAAGAMRAREGGKWQATLITAGEGSSGIYSEEMLAERGPVAFPKGTKLWFVHPDAEQGKGPGDRDPRDLWGVLEEDATYVEGEGLTGKIRVLPHWKDVVESIGDLASLSIYSVGERDEDGNVTLGYHRTNSIDMVGYPGREGSGLTRKLEAARAASTDRSAASAGEPNPQEESMDRKDVEEIVNDALTEALKPINTFIADEAARRQAEADAQESEDAEENDVQEAVKAAVKSVEAIKAAQLLPSQEAALIEAAQRGEDVTAGIESAKKVIQEAQSTKGGSSYVHESAGADDDFSIGVF